MEIIIIWLVAAVVIGIIAGNRNRNGFGWFLLAIFISPLLALVLVLSLRQTQPPSRPSYVTRDEELLPAMKKCPRCAEEVKAAAHVCRFCGHEFVADVKARTSDEIEALIAPAITKQLTETP